MAIVQLVMPKMGESIMEATILKWLKNVGDTINMDETLLEIATDKVDSEVPSTVAGTITEILYKVDDVVPVGTVIATIDTEASTAQPVATPATEPVIHSEPITQIPVAPAHEIIEVQQAPIAAPTPVNIPAAATEPLIQHTTSSNKYYSPLVLNIANQENVSITELSNINGTGNDGRVTKKDVLDYVANRQSGTVSQAPAAPLESPVASPTIAQAAPIATPTNITNIQANAPSPAPQATAPTPSPETLQTTPTSNPSGNVEIIEMDRMRKLIADHMVKSKATSPHVTSFTEADVTNIVNWRNKIKNNFEKKYGEKITFTPLFIEAVVKAIKKYPMINCSVDGTKIIVKKDINIGMAAALPSGNLIVPVIKNSDAKNLYGLTKEVNQMANAARSGKLKPEDTQGGTFTLTNVGTFGSLMGTPIINQPQVAILAVGSIKKRPMVLETEHGDVIAIRHMMYLSLSYDHRVVDGSLGASFLTQVANELEAFDIHRDI